MKNKLLSNKYFKGTLAFIGLILISAVGSAIWEVFLKPLSTFIIRDILLNLITFGLDSIRNDIYSSVALGYNQSSTVLLFHYFVVIAISAMIIFLLYVFSRRGELMEKHKRLIKELDDSLSEINNMGKTIEKTREEIIEEDRGKIIKIREGATSVSFKRLNILLYILVFISVYQSTLLITDLIKTTYVNSAITHYNQIVAISSPYYNPKEIALHNSQYAQITNREDYIRLTASIEATIKNHGILPPTFSAW